MADAPTDDERRDDFDAADAAFKKRGDQATFGNEVDRDAAVRWHWRGFQDGAESVRHRTVQGEPTPLARMKDALGEGQLIEVQGEPSDAADSDLIAWHTEQVEVLRPFLRSSAHRKAAMMHAATVRALRAAAATEGGER